MPSWIIALLFGISIGTWAYTKLVHANGNPTPGPDLAGGAIVGFIAFVVLFTLMKFVFNF